MGAGLPAGAVPLRPADTPLARRRQRADYIARHGGFPVTAVMVQANAMLFTRRDDEDYPCAVVFTPDPTVSDDHLEEVARFVAKQKNTHPTDPDLAMLADYVTNEPHVPYRRRRIAPRFTGGEDVFLADLMVYRDYLPDGRLHGRDRLACVAEPGEYGGLELLPEPRDL